MNLAAFAKPKFDPVFPFGGGRQGVHIDFSKMERLAQDIAGTTPVTTLDNPVGWIKSLDPTERIVTAPTSGNRPPFKTNGSVLFNASNYAFLQDFTSAAVGNSILAKMTVPASVSATQIIAGLTVGSTRFYLAVTTAGVIAGGCGSQNTTVIKGNVDYRGQTIVAGISENGDIWTLFVLSAAGLEVIRGKVAGGPMPTSSFYRIGCQNNDGSGANYSGSNLFRLLIINSALSIDDMLSWAAL